MNHSKSTITSPSGGHTGIERLLFARTPGVRGAEIFNAAEDERRNGLQ